MNELDQIDDLDLLDESLNLDDDLSESSPAAPTPVASNNNVMLAGKAANLSLIKDIPVEITVEVSRTSLLLKEMMELGPDNVILLDKKEGEPVDVKVNGVLFGTGQIVAQEGRYGVKILSLVDNATHV